ncbi:alanine dehydrogenase [Paraburkholderia phenoliruptrix]|uniref:Alanine dehydrogenase n=2 Tax=Paraburkholderia phenoliruptrix TaxID=252970 RepID=K0DXJ5_9BURK|nr:alanine dehydrogenase [Paraburkholderia phenoliruptrix]AFT89417.1 alanine dehydrogenase [Paraburkholderia phenoliruptrix BR3459a]MDR6421927.1 alanine dehydrogenase [Paraburkholderia phenoliruptrix]WMY10464.1 alanine dehydrogenase [Paraburkholderia phenoliruptrix]CAB4050641.1 Alanine dehydrogenase [Paraburkholderia phenoliruptrix]
MHVGVPKEIKNHEYRVGLTPSSVREMVAHGHTVTVETGAGNGIGASDAVYEKAGAKIVPRAEEVFATAELIIKVKEPQAGERAMLREGQILFTYLHLAPDPAQCADLVKSNAVCIAYETVTQAAGGLPLLAPMSEVAGRMSIQAGAFCLERAHGGKGILLGGVAGVPSAKIVILGAGVVGSNAAQIAVGTGAQVVVIDRNLDALRRMDRLLGARVMTVFSNQDNVEKHVLEADLVIGGVLIPGAAAPKLVTRAMVEAMQPGAAIVDVAIDQGGCCETARPTTHAEPTYRVGDVVHYCVANMPGGVPRTSTYALNNATLPFALQIADKGWRKALQDDAHLRNGLNVALGKVTCREVAEALDYTWESPESVMAM